jgi:hypothetical protein
VVELIGSAVLHDTAAPMLPATTEPVCTKDGACSCTFERRRAACARGKMLSRRLRFAAEI